PRLTQSDPPPAARWTGQVAPSFLRIAPLAPQSSYENFTGVFIRLWPGPAGLRLRLQSQAECRQPNRSHSPEWKTGRALRLGQNDSRLSNLLLERHGAGDPEKRLHEYPDLCARRVEPD